MENLKPLPVAHGVIDTCMECGFCESACPSGHVTLTPRQRIVATRELARLDARGEVAPFTFQYSPAHCRVLFESFIQCSSEELAHNNPSTLGICNLGNCTSRSWFAWNHPDPLIRARRGQLTRLYRCLSEDGSGQGRNMAPTTDLNLPVSGNPDSRTLPQVEDKNKANEMRKLYDYQVLDTCDPPLETQPPEASHLLFNFLFE